MTKRTYTRGDVVGVQSRKGDIDCVIAGTRMIQRGRHAGTIEYTCAPLQDVGKTYQFTAKGERWFKDPRRTYTPAEIAAALGEREETADKIATRKAERTERGRDALGDIDFRRSTRDKQSGTNIGIGDEVCVNYRDVGRRWERVAFVNFQIGKVAIARKLPSYYSEQDAMDELFRIAGYRTGGRRRGPKPYRYIHPDQIVDVRSPRKACPVKVSERMAEQIADRGWAQPTFGSEFIERSYVVADSREHAKLGATYECAENVIYHDPDLNVWWRATGSFD